MVEDPALKPRQLDLSHPAKEEAHSLLGTRGCFSGVWVVVGLLGPELCALGGGLLEVGVLPSSLCLCGSQPACCAEQWAVTFDDV